jgi:putative molybdopterin biosynthesis protein
MAEQEQFLEVIDRDLAERRFHAALALAPLPPERVALACAWGRVLAEDVCSPVDVPAFDRANVDGYAVRAADTFGATEQAPRRLPLRAETIHPGHAPTCELRPGQAVAIATGGMLPRGADAVVMVEHTDVAPAVLRASQAAWSSTATEPASAHPTLIIRRALAPGANVTFAGTDLAAGELLVAAGTQLSSRDTGVLAAAGIDQVAVTRQPRVAVLSTGNELLAPGEPPRPAAVFDSNQRIIADAVREAGGVPVELGIVPDEADALRTRLREAIAGCEVVLLSGGTSKGSGDLSYRVVSELNDPGIVAHGVALKPGKPICLAATQGKAVVVLPGFPTSAVFTFHEFVAPVIRRLAGLRERPRHTVSAELAVKINSEIGRTEYVLVNLVRAAEEAHGSPAMPEYTRHGTSSAAAPRLVAWPLGKGSGSVTTFSRADGFVTIGRHEEIVAAGSPVEVTLLGDTIEPADLVVIGSHCLGLDLVLSELNHAGSRTKSLLVGSLAGLEAARRGQCDVAGVHLLDPASGLYNEPFVTPDLMLVRGYGRMQGVVFRPGDARFDGRTAAAAIAVAAADPRCVMINRNAGSGTRLLIDQYLGGARPAGYAVQPRNHSAVAAAVKQGRADWGVCIASAAQGAGLGFLPLQLERYDFLVPRSRAARPAVQAFRALLASPPLRARLAERGFDVE